MYKRSEWYGLMYLTNMRGSMLPKASLPGIVAAIISVLIHFRIINIVVSNEELTDWLTESYGMQLLGIVFGYLCVTRINMSYSRYWEGVTHVKTMHSKCVSRHVHPSRMCQPLSLPSGRPSAGGQTRAHRLSPSIACDRLTAIYGTSPSAGTLCASFRSSARCALPAFCPNLAQPLRTLFCARSPARCFRLVDRAYLTLTHPPTHHRRHPHPCISYLPFRTLVQGDDAPPSSN